MILMRAGISISGALAAQGKFGQRSITGNSSGSIRELPVREEHRTSVPAHQNALCESWVTLDSHHARNQKSSAPRSRWMRAGSGLMSWSIWSRRYNGPGPSAP